MCAVTVPLPAARTRPISLLAWLAKGGQSGVNLVSQDTMKVYELYCIMIRGRGQRADTHRHASDQGREVTVPF